MIKSKIERIAERIAAIQVEDQAHFGDAAIMEAFQGGTSIYLLAAQFYSLLDRRTPSQLWGAEESVKWERCIKHVEDAIRRGTARRA